MTDFPTIYDNSDNLITLGCRVQTPSDIQDRLDIGTVVDYIEADGAQPPLLVVEFGNDDDDEDYVIRYDGDGAFSFVPELEVLDPNPYKEPL